MSAMLQHLITRLNQLRHLSTAAAMLIHIMRALVFAGIMLELWALVQPEQQGAQLVLFLLVFALSLGLGAKKTSNPIEAKNVLFEMELNHPNTLYSPFHLRDSHPVAEAVKEWEPHCNSKLKSYGKYELNRLSHLLLTLPIPVLLMAIVTDVAPGSISAALANASRAVTDLRRGATLTIIDGAPSDEAKKPFTLSAKETLKIEVLAQNMMQIEVVGKAPDQDLRVDLKKRIPGKTVTASDPVFQSFRLSPLRDNDATSSKTYNIAFAVTDDSAIFLPFLSTSVPVAEVLVRQLPTPKVRIEVSKMLRDPWPDDQAIPLRIDVTAENPLQLVRLLIRTGGKTSVELVTNVLALDKKELSTEYSLVLETYVQSDLAEVEVIAEAVDRALPTPLVGQSAPLLIKTASAFGRYRETLQTLREVKSHLDDAITKQDPKLPAETPKLMERALSQAQDSPFFDSLDRLVINRIDQSLRESNSSNSMLQLVEASESLNDFLFEHEILDDKERDRDFFVAARSLSRLIEQKPKDRGVPLPEASARMKTFLDGRSARWQARIARLPKEFHPKSWPKIEKKPFQKAIDDITELDSKKQNPEHSAALTLLSQTVGQYREWLEELEEREEAARSIEEAKRQQGLSAARDQIRELQKQQGRISTNLDQAATIPEAEMAQKWPTARMNQNTNIKDTGSVEAQLRSLSPLAGERINAALTSMKDVVEAGNQKNFNGAESASDLAGRLLRQAESATKKSQQKNQRGRRKRVTGDNYYGQQITGGDIEIKREYEVNRRYREDILDEVGRYESTNDDQGEATLIENYLRRVIR